MKNLKLHVETLEERALLAVVAGGIEEVAISPAPTGGTTWVVNTVDDPTEWDTSDNILSLREAISSAREGDTIKFDAMLSEGWIILNGTQLEISKAITIDASETGGITLDANVKNRIFYVSGGTLNAPVELIGLTVISGKVKSGNGGGIYNTGALKLIGCSILGNTSGGIANYNSLNLIGCTILGNYGEGILNTRSSAEANIPTLYLENCTVSENSNQGIYNNQGSINLLNSDILHNAGNGIDNTSAYLKITGCNIHGNSGSGVYITNSNADLVKCNISENFGGLYCSTTSSSVTISLKDCTVVNNRVSNSGGVAYGGGGIYNNGCKSFTLTNCQVLANSSSGGSGGGISNYSGTMTLINCVIADNECMSNGGGIYSIGTLRLTNCTIVNNSTSKNTGCGGGVYKQGLAYFFNSIVLMNSAKKEGSDIYSYSDSTYAYNSISSYTDWTVSSNCPEYDSDLPLFVDAENGNYDLPADSQAVNNGKNSYILNYPTDVAGNERISGEIVDIGAYEYQFEVPPAEPLDTPSILTGNLGVYVSYGANRHQITWNAVENASGYELAYSADGSSWTTVAAGETSAVITGLTYGADMQYRVRALGTGTYTDSDWSEIKTFSVCPMDINGDGDISGGDRTLLANSWLSEEGGDEYRYYCDINADGDIGGADRTYLVNNWLGSDEDDDLVYPPAKRADAVFAEFASADLDADLNVF